MSAAPTATRVYNALRDMVVHRGFRPGARLDPAELKDRLGSSVTPVRDALHVLSGEGLVQTAPGGGFHTMPLDEPDLCDLYGWTAEVLGLAVRRWPEGIETIPAEIADMDVADRTAALFLWIARRSRNVEHARAIERTNARLHGARMVEARFLPGAAEALATIAASCACDDRATVHRHLFHHQRERERIAGRIVRVLYRNGE